MISNTMLSILVKYQWIQPTSQSLPLQRGWWFDFLTSLVLINTCLFWSLHIEISLLIISGQGMEGSGLDEIMSKCGLSTVRADSLVTVNDLKRAVYCLQVGASVIYSKLMQAHIGSDELIFCGLPTKARWMKCVFVGNWSSNLWPNCLSS